MKFVDILLKEGRKEDLKKKYSQKFDNEVIDFVLGVSDLQDFNHKYTDWVLKVLEPETDVDMNVEIAVELVKDFDKYQKQLEKKDINQYLSFEELEKALEPFKEKEKEKELENQTEKIYEDDNFLVLVPKTIEASCKYGSGTKWCTTVKDADHFRRYTSGKQGLYYIIRKKGKEYEPNYKVAVHINEAGYENWWDSRDHQLGGDTVTLFKEYFPELYSKIKEHSEEKTKSNFEELNKVFEKKGHNFSVYGNFHGVHKDILLDIYGYDLISDMPGKAVGKLKIYLNVEVIDEYDVFVSYSLKKGNQWGASVGFSEESDEEPKFDFKLWESWGYDVMMNFNYPPEELRLNFDKILLGKVFRKIFENEEFEKFLKNITGPTWRASRINHGYTFGKNKGLIKKLIDYLDSGYDNGTKLDFLEYIGKLKTRVVNGKKEYAHSYSDVYHPSKQFRGHFASFFASAKHAGIIDYVKEGSKFIIKKGRNFEPFKKGELRAL
jgi:hypothetical protein